MAKVFLDTNCFIGLVNRASEIDPEYLDNHESYISVLSCHILFYVNKIKVPNKDINSFIEDFNLIPVTENILEKALLGPTHDFEDNVQLHSAAEGECDVFLTGDKKLLSMKFFGKVRITNLL